MKLKVPPMPKTPGASTSIPNPSKVGTQATVKMPKAKSMPDAFDKPSKFFGSITKTEKTSTVKHPSVQKLKAFLERSKAKK